MVELPHDADQDPSWLCTACQRSYSQPVERSRTVMWWSPAGSGCAFPGIGTPTSLRAGAQLAVSLTVTLGVVEPAYQTGTVHCLAPIAKPPGAPATSRSTIAAEFE